MNPLEILAASLGVANILLVIRRSIWNFPVALGMVSLYALVFLEARLYSDMALQGFFFVVNVYGWIAWSRQAALGEDIRVRRLGPRARLGWGAAILAAGAGWGTAMHRLTDAALPYADAGVAMGSVAAQILLARRFLENWPLWVAVDLLAVGVYLARHLYLTAALYALLLVLAVVGWRAWARAPRDRGGRVPA